MESSALEAIRAQLALVSDDPALGAAVVEPSTTLRFLRRAATALLQHADSEAVWRAGAEETIGRLRAAVPSPSDREPVPLTLLSDDPTDPLYRLVLEDGARLPSGQLDHTLITICEEELTSTRSTARTIKIRNAIDFTEKQARWLYAALGQVLAGRAAKEGSEPK